MTNVPTVHVVHCVDTEGPLYVSREAVFEDLAHLFGIHLQPTAENLQRLQAGALDLGGVEAEVRRIVSPERLAYLDSWPRLDAVLDELATPAFRNRLPDSFGNGWVFSWFCVDHVGYRENPRCRTLGFHAIFDRYRSFVAQPSCARDCVQFHHHPMPFSRAAHHSATHYFSHAPIIFEILARRILERDWFPYAYRPGFHVERPDSHWLLEQFIPFDFANQSQEGPSTAQRDQSGRFGDWRRAPSSWCPYHPAHDDYQATGNCRRWIARVLNLDSRHHLLSEADVDQAFREAADGKPVVMAVTDHDFRDMRPDVDRVRKLLATVAPRHPHVRFRYCDAREAMRLALGLSSSAGPRLDIGLQGELVTISADRPIFGPQPFLALEGRDGRFLHDNLDMQTPFRRWTYTLDEQTVPVAAMKALGVAAADSDGGVGITRLDAATGQVRRTSL